jgi:tetratricopeptide (TPR) repeat protein
MVRPLAAVLVGLVLVSCSSRAEEAKWPVPRGASREPSPYRYDPKALAKVPRDFLDDSVATVLYAGNTHIVEKDGTIETITHEITRLNFRKGVEKLGEYRNITFTPSYQKLTLNEARIHKRNGKVIDVEARHAHLRDVATDYQVYDPEKQLIITFPTLEVGDVIEVKWTIRGKNPEHHGQFFTRYSFGDPLYPVAADEFRVLVAKDRPLKYGTAYGEVLPAINETGDQKLYTWKKINCPRQPRDEDPPSKEELRTSLMVSTFTSWDEVGRWKSKLRAGCWKCTPEIEQVVKEAIKGFDKPLDKARALTYWVRRNVRYVSVGDKHDYTPHPPGKVLANRYGDCKDTSQLLAVMLRAIGIKVELATLGALDDGQVLKDVPSPWGTHAILCATIDGKEHWIDTTAQLAAWDFLPRDDADRLCYLTDEHGKVRLQTTPKGTPERNRIEQITDVWIGTDGTTRSRRTVLSEGSAAIIQRDTYVEAPLGERRRQVASELQDANNRSKLIHLSVDEKALHDHDRPVKVQMEFEIPKHFTPPSDDPAALEGSFTDSKVWGKLLSHNFDYDRKVPLVLPAAFETIHTYRIHVPAAFEADGLPRDKSFTCRWGSFTSKSRKLDAKDDALRNVEVVFHTRIATPRIEVKDLEAYRKFFDDVYNNYRVYLTIKPTTRNSSIPLLEGLLAVSPQNSFAALTLARIYLENDQQLDARRILKRACYYNPDDSALWELRATAAADTPEEESTQRELVKRFPEETRYALGLAEILITNGGKLPEARELLKGLTTKGDDASRALAHFQLARICYKKDELKQALDHLNEARRIDPGKVNTVRIWTLRGQVLEELNKPAEAMQAYNKVLELDPKNPNPSALLSLVRLALVTKDKPAALQYLHRYTLVAGKDVSGLLLAAETYLNLAHYDQAFELALRAREIRFHEKAQRILGLVYLHRGDDAKALLHLEKAEPDSVVLAAMIRATINQGKVRDLAPLIDKAGRIDKPSEMLRLANQRAQQLVKRRGELNKLVRIPAGKESEYAAALDALACAEEAYHNAAPEKRIRSFLDPACKPTLAIGPALALRGRLALERGKLRLALADATRAIELSPADPLGYLVRGRVRLERTEASALADLEKAAELSSRKDADVLQALAEALAAAGRYGDAIKAQKAAIELRPKDQELADQLVALEKAAKEKGARH